MSKRIPIIIVLILVSCGEQSCSFIKGKRLLASFIILKGPYGSRQCIRECLLRTRCLALGYSGEQLRCELSDTEAFVDSSYDSSVATRAMLTEYKVNLGSCEDHDCSDGQRCISRGQASTPLCAFTECDSPTIVPHGSATSNISVVGIQADYVCDPPYEICGQSGITCRPSGQWTTPLFSCCAAASETCNFDNDMCGWLQETSGGDMFDWERNAGSTATSDTGPSKDHTSGSGSYVYIEASLNDPGDYAVLKSGELQAGVQCCLEFYYHMYGSSMGILTVLVQQGSTNETVFQRSGNQENAWHHAVVQIAAQNSPFVIILKGEKGSSVWGDIAIDDTTIRYGTCTVS